MDAFGIDDSGQSCILDVCIMAHFGRGQACSMPILHGLMSLTSNLKERSVRSLRRMHTDSQRSFILLLASSVIYSRASPCAMDRPSVPCVCACYYILRAGIVFFSSRANAAQSARRGNLPPRTRLCITSQSMPPSAPLTTLALPALSPLWSWLSIQPFRGDI